MKSLSQVLGIGLLVAGVLFWAEARAQEHPEHPKSGEKPKAEHPEHPEQTEETDVTLDGLAEAIESWVKTQTKLQGGYFVVWDAQDQKALVLTLDTVHRERLSKLETNVYFACADFKAKGGGTYDLDMFMKPLEDELVATEVKVHKKDGKARYTWFEENGVWKTKPAP